MKVLQSKRSYPEAGANEVQSFAHVLSASGPDLSTSKLLYIGPLSKEFCRKLIEFDYLGITLQTSFKAYLWLEKMAESHEWSEKMGQSCNDLPLAIICDWKLTDGYALDLFERLRKHKTLKKIPFIGLAENVSKEMQMEAVRRGIDDLYDVNVYLEDLNSRIEFLQGFKEKILPSQQEARDFEEFRIPRSKRIFDILVSLSVLILFSPLFLLIALLIKLESKGPVCYVSKRAGTGYRVFNFYKFRSMYVGSDRQLKEVMHLNQYEGQESSPPMDLQERCIHCIVEGKACSAPMMLNGKQICEKSYKKVLDADGRKSSFVKIKNDPRITPFGHILRNTSLDEFPQLINVLKGDMSIVGNRPLPLYEAEQLTTDYWAKRFLAPAGITGLWQVKRRGKGRMSEEERKKMDVAYADNASFWNDIKIVIQTIPALLQRKSV